MSEENVELVKSLFDRYEAGDQTAWRDHFAEDIVWDTSMSAMPGAGVYRGHAGVQEFFRDWLTTWEDPTLVPLELIDAGDSVVVVFRWQGRGKTSGAPVERLNFGIYDLRDGTIVGYRQYETRADALKAAGLGGGSTKRR